MSMTMEQEVRTLVSVLKDENFSVKVDYLTSLNPFSKGVYQHWSFTKTTGTRKSEVNGGFLQVRDDGMVTYYFFKGLDKYGKHLKSKPDDLYGGDWTTGWTTDPFLKEVVQFLTGPN